MAAVLAPVIIGALGITAGTTAAVVGTALVGAALSIGTGYLARELAPKPNSQAQGMRLQMRATTNEFREIALGRVASEGSFKFWNTYGPNGNDYVQLVYVLADHECDGLERVWANGVELTLGERISNATVSGHPVAEYPGRMWIEWHSGAWDQDADADLVAKVPGGAWPSSNRGRGVCYVRVTLKYDPQMFASGRPTFRFEFRGAKLYDWRKDDTAGGSGDHRWGDESTYAWTDNAHVIRYNYRRGIYVNGHRLGGMSTPIAALPLAEWTAAANADDEFVALKGGGTEKRYRLNAIVSVNQDHNGVLRDMVTASAGIEVDSNGVIKAYSGVSLAPVMTMTDADIVSKGPMSYAPKLSRAVLVNTVYGTSQDPSQLYESHSLPPRISPDDAATDKVQLSEHYGLAYVTSGTQGQRILEILRRKGRHQRRVTLTLRARFRVLEAGDWISWTSSRFGFTTMNFVVEQAQRLRGGNIQVTLRQVSATIFAWNPAVDELDPADPSPVAPGGSTFDTVAGVALENTTVAGIAGAQLPGLRITWTPITDATVTELALAYRKVGDTVAMTRTILDPTTGSYEWVEGVQGGLQYEAQLDLVTLPKRATVKTAWVQTPDTSGAHKVDASVVSEIAEDIPDGIVTHPKLSHQVEIELAIASARADVEASVAGKMDQVRDGFARVAEALLNVQTQVGQHGAFIRREEIIRQTDTESFAQNLTAVSAYLAGSGATIVDIATAVANGESSIAEQITAVESIVGSNTAAVGVMQGVVDGIKAYFAITVDVNGRWGVFRMDGTGSEIDTILGTDKFKLVSSTVNGGAPMTMFVSEIVDGTPRHVLNGDVYVQKLLANTVDAVNIKSDAIEACHVKFDELTGDHIQSDTIEGRHLKFESITGDHIAANSLTVNEIAINGLTGDVLTETVETLDVYPTTTSTTFVDIPGTEIEVTVADNEKLLLIFNAVFSGASDLQATPIYRIMMDGAVAPNTPVYFAGSGNTLSITQTTPVIIAPTASFTVILSPEAGTHTFKAQWRRPGWDSAARITFRSLQIMRFLR